MINIKKTKPIPNASKSLRDEYLAIIKQDNIFGLIDIVKKGIYFAHFSNIAKENPFKIEEWSEFLQIPLQPILYYESQNKRFDSIHSDKILEIKILADEGLRVFGSKEKFYKWLKSESQLFEGKKPIEFLSSTIGITLVKDELIRIEHGVLA